MIYVDNNGNLNLSQLHQKQKDFVRSNCLHTGLVGGYQSGKSVAGTVKVLTKLLKNPGVPCAYYLPTYRLIQDMLVPKFEKLFTECNILYRHLKQDNSFVTKYGKIMMRSLDNPNSIISYSVGYSLVDEFDVVSKDKMKLAHGRIVSRNSYRSPAGEKNCIDFVSTPEGFGFAYNFFVKNNNSNKKLLKISTRDNANNLADSYITGLYEAYTETQLKAYLDGDFVNMNAGTVFYAFDRNVNHSTREIEFKDVLHVGMDFNITKMSAVIHVTDRNIVTAVEEVTGAYDTPEMILKLKDRYPKRKIVVYPDASGDARNTAGDSDIKLLKKAGFKIRVNRSNPSVKDRITDANVGFRNAKGESNYFVNTNNCPDYTEGLEKLSYKKGLPDKDSGLDHVTDAGTYCFYKIKNTNSHTRINV